MTNDERMARKIIPFPGRRVDEKPAFPLRLTALVVAALLGGQALEVLHGTRQVAPVTTTPDAIDLPLAPAKPGR